MKVVDIITCDMHQLHGANKVTEKLILGREIFHEKNIKIRYVISQDGIIDCSNYTQSNLGTELGTKKYSCKRKLIEMLKKLPFYKTYYIQKRIVLKQIENNRKVLDYVKCIEEKPDFIIYQDPFTAIYYLEKTHDDTPALFISHADTDPLEQFFLGRPSLKNTKFERELRDKFSYLFSTVNKVVTICSSSKKYMKEVYGLDCPCILNGIEDCDKQAVNHANKTPLDICIVGSVNYRKGQDLAIEAISQLMKEEKEKVRLHIVGGGAELHNIKDQVKKLGLEEEVIIHGPVLDVAYLLSGMDVFLLPSRADTVPIAIIEAMRAGLPVFATEVGEIPEMISGCGRIISNNVDLLTETFRNIINNKYNLDDMGRNSRNKFLDKFLITSMINNYAAVIESLND